MASCRVVGGFCCGDHDGSILIDVILLALESLRGIVSVFRPY